MALSSMTGFARSHGASGPYAFEWELKSVNAKGFDLRMRLPPDGTISRPSPRNAPARVLSRGTVYAILNVKRATRGFPRFVSQRGCAGVDRQGCRRARRQDRRGGADTSMGYCRSRA